jgi:hypothetical protein
LQATRTALRELLAERLDLERAAFDRRPASNPVPLKNLSAIVLGIFAPTIFRQDSKEKL